MPLAIDEERFSKQETLDMSKPQGTPQGIPVKQIPHMEYPKAVYRHPIEPFFKIEHRNVHHEIVEVETVPSEHKVHICQNKEEFEAKIKDGWVSEPYIQQAPPDPTEKLYQRAPKQKA